MKSTNPNNEFILLRNTLLEPNYQCFGQKIELYHDLNDEHVEEEEMPLFAMIRGALFDIIGRVEQEIRNYMSDEGFDSSLITEPCMDFEDPYHRDHPEEWKFLVHRTDWEDFEYCLKFRGTTFQRFFAGD